MNNPYLNSPPARAGPFSKPPHHHWW